MEPNSADFLFSQSARGSRLGVLEIFLPVFQGVVRGGGLFSPLPLAERKTFLTFASRFGRDGEV
ncbi:hypothetical protein ACFSRY_10370, partial [Pontibacter locisalis]